MSRLIIGGYVEVGDKVYIQSRYTDGEGIVETVISNSIRTTDPWVNEIDVAWRGTTFMDGGTRTLFKTKELAMKYEELLENDDSEGVQELFSKYYTNFKQEEQHIKDF